MFVYTICSLLYLLLLNNDRWKYLAIQSRHLKSFNTNIIRLKSRILTIFTFILKFIARLCNIECYAIRNIIIDIQCIYICYSHDIPSFFIHSRVSSQIVQLKRSATIRTYTWFCSRTHLQLLYSSSTGCTKISQIESRTITICIFKWFFSPVTSLKCTFSWPYWSVE